MYNAQLETFLRVADAGSFNKAAEEAYITPTAIIKQINALEKRIGIQLFERTHRGLILTPAGQSLYRDSQYIISYCKDSILRAQNAMQEDAMVVRIGSSPVTPAQLLMKFWPKIQEYCHEMKIQIVPFENTEENAREILLNLGKNIDVVAGIFDETMLRLRKCAGFELSREPFCCAVSIYHPLAEKEKLTIEDLYGQNLMLMHRGWSHSVDILRDEICQKHRKIQIVDFDFYNVDAFNRCANQNDILLTISGLEGVHPLLKILPVEWEHSIPYGLLYSVNPSDTVKKLINGAHMALKN